MGLSLYRYVSVPHRSYCSRLLRTNQTFGSCTTPFPAHRGPAYQVVNGLVQEATKVLELQWDHFLYGE